MTNNLRLKIYGLFVVSCLLSVVFLIYPNNAHAGTIIKSPAYLGLQRGLVGCWSFDGAYTNAPDCSGNNNVGVLTSGPLKATGRVGQALSFDGVDDWVRINNSPPLQITGTLTVSAWIKVTTHTAVYREIFRKGDNYFLILNNANKVALSTSNVAGEYNDGFAYTADNRWHLITGTFNGTICSMYLDDVFQTSYACGALVSDNTNAVIGAHPNGDSQFFKGSIDDVRIYNRALSQVEISRLYRIGLGSTTGHTSTSSSWDKGLVGYWTFDGADIGLSGTQAKDRSGNNNHGTLNGGPTSAIGKIGQALSFDGNDDVQIANESNFDLNLISVSAWIKINALDLNYQSIVTKGDTSWRLHRYQQTNNLSFGTTKGTVDNDLQGTVNVNDGRWHYAVAVYDGVNKYLYVDGALDNSTSYSGTLDTNDFAVDIGENLEQTGRQWKGLIDDVRVYNRALSASEIQNLYNETQSKYNVSRTDVLKKGLVGHWTFDGADTHVTSQLVLDDKSGFENTATSSGTTIPGKILGKVGQALDFDGSNDWINVNHSSSLNFGVPYTLAAWFKVDNVSGVKTILTKGSSGVAFAFGIGLNGASIMTTHHSGNVTSSAVTVNTGAWHHFVAVTAGSTDYFYYDGALVDSQSTLANAANSFPLGIGAMCSGAGCSQTQFFNGSIDEVRIYNRALSAGEIQKLYNMGR